MSKKLKWSVLGVAVLGVGALASLAAFKRGGDATTVRIEAVEPRDLVASVTASGPPRR